VLLAPANESLSAVSFLGGAGALSGLATARAVNGIATFTDLSIDAAGSFNLSFSSPLSLRARFPTRADFAARQPLHPLAVGVGPAASLRFDAAAVDNVPPEVAVVDAGGNLVASDSTTNVTSRVFNPAQSASFARPAPPFSTTGAKRVTHFEAGGRSLVAVANQFDGSGYNIDSAIYEWSPSANPPSLNLFQQLSTSGAYAFTALDLPVSGTSTDSFLAVANHYDDTTAYSALSRVYRLSGGAYTEVASLQTYGAAHIESFSVGGGHYLAVANFFDGTFHTVDSDIYRWHFAAGAWTLGAEPVQRLPTSAAHHIAFFEHGGEAYLAVSQHWDERASTYALSSPVYKWDRAAARFEPLGSLPTQAALQMEPFAVGGAMYLAVANSVDALTGKAEANSTIYRLSCGAGGDSFTPVQNVVTNGATRWRHFTRGGIPHLAVAQWVPQNASKVEVLAWDGASFVRYAELPNDGAFDVDVIADSTGYYLVQTLPADTSSLLEQLAELDGGGAVVPPASETSVAASGRAVFTAPGAVPASPSAYWDTWVVDFFADGLAPASSGPYKAP